MKENELEMIEVEGGGKPTAPVSASKHESALHRFACFVGKRPPGA